MSVDKRKARAEPQPIQIPYSARYIRLLWLSAWHNASISTERLSLCVRVLSIIGLRSPQQRPDPAVNISVGRTLADRVLLG